ncbi:MAG: polysaccharide deacetylase family protein [Lachnospiraceae bacterium]
MKKRGKVPFSEWFPAVFFLLFMLAMVYRCVLSDTSDPVQNVAQAWEPEQVQPDHSDSVEEGDMEIALTFDDGPHPVWTEKLLDGLKERGIRATFFVIGKSAEEYPELVQRMVDEGNQVGNHTYSHVQLTACSEASALEEIRKTQEVIYQASGFRTCYIRPPFGSWNEKLQEETSLEAVLWDVDPYDWKVQNTDAVVKSILQQTEDGSIILLHDVYETSVEAALKVADIFLEKGYRFCTVDEIMIE